MNGQSQFNMEDDGGRNHAMTLRCLHVDTQLNGNKLDLSITFSLVSSLTPDHTDLLKDLKDREFTCDDAVLSIHDSEVSAKCGNTFTSHRTEIKFHIFADSNYHKCHLCNMRDISVEKCITEESDTTSVWKNTGSDESVVPESSRTEGDGEMGEPLNTPNCDGEIVAEGCANCDTKTTCDTEDKTQSETVEAVTSCNRRSEENTTSLNLTTEKICEKVTNSDSCSGKCSGEKEIYKCEVFCDQTRLRDHMENHGENSCECPECGKLFNRIKALKRHKLNHHSNIPVYICKVCKTGFTVDEDLRYHVYTVHKGSEKSELPDQMFKCSICPKTFSKSSLLKNHLRLHRNGKPFRCLYCGITFKDELSFQLHHEIHQGANGMPFMCKNCGQCFSSLTLLKKHKASHEGEIYRCDICGKIFQSGKSLRDHMNIHRGIRSYVCNICGKALVSANRLKSHVKTHIIDKPYKCDFCEKSFINPGDLTNHRRVHTGEKPYLCEICGKGFAYKTSVPKHMVIHSDKRPYQCDVCNKKFASSLQMYNHKKIHLGLKNFICEVCGKRFTTGKALKVHKLMHEGYTGHSCEVCGKKYRNVYYLEIHKKTHTGKNLLQCHMCGDSFADPTYFKLHQKKFCKTVLIYCDLCNRGFPNNKDLKSHMGFHSGERPYGCDVCGKAFAKSVFLTDHMKRHNPDTLIRCSVCGKGFINKKEVRRHEARHKNINKKRASPRIAVSVVSSTVNQDENRTVESSVKQSLDPTEPSTILNTESHDKVLQEYVESIESIKKSVIPSPPDYNSAVTSDSVPLVYPPGPPQGVSEESPHNLPISLHPVQEQGTVYYGQMSCNQSVSDQMNSPITNSVETPQSYPPVFTRESGEILLMQEGLAAVMNQTDRQTQTYVSQYYYPQQQQNRFGEVMPKY